MELADSGQIVLCWGLVSGGLDSGILMGPFSISLQEHSFPGYFAWREGTGQPCHTIL